MGAAASEFAACLRYSLPALQLAESMLPVDGAPLCCWQALGRLSQVWVACMRASVRGGNAPGAAHVPCQRTRGRKGRPLRHPAAGHGHMDIWTYGHGHRLGYRGPLSSASSSCVAPSVPQAAAWHPLCLKQLCGTLCASSSCVAPSVPQAAAWHPLCLKQLCGTLCASSSCVAP